MKGIGVTKNDLKTENFSITVWQEWENRKHVKKGYQAIHGMKIVNNSIELIGKILSKTSRIRGLEVLSLHHELSFKTRQKELKTLYAQAFSSASSKITAILKAAGKRFHKYQMISEDVNERVSVPHFRVSAGNIGAMKASRGPEISVSLVPLAIKLNTRLKVIGAFK